MLNNFYVKFFLFCILLLLLAIIINAKRDTLNLPVVVKNNVNQNEGNGLYRDEYLIYVSDFNNLIFPLNVIVKEDKNFTMSYYEDKINSALDKKIYTTFSLLTNYSNYLPKGVQTFLPKEATLVDYKLEDKVLTLKVSDDFYYYSKDNEAEMFKIIHSTFTSIDSIESIVIDNNSGETKILNEFYHLNVFFNTANINNSNEYVVYFYTNINNNYYLVKANIYEQYNNLSKEENVLNILTNTLNIPVFSFVETSKIRNLNKNDTLPYYQYYLTCFENQLIEEDHTVNIKNINYYEILLK